MSEPTKTKVRYTGKRSLLVTPPPDPATGDPRPQFGLSAGDEELAVAEVDLDIAADLCRRRDVEPATKAAEKAIAAYRPTTAAQPDDATAGDAHTDAEEAQS